MSMNTVFCKKRKRHKNIFPKEGQLLWSLGHGVGCRLLVLMKDLDDFPADW